MTKSKKRKNSMASRLESLSRRMAEMSAELEYYGSFNADLRDKANQLLHSSAIVRIWATKLRADIAERKTLT